MHLPYTDRYPEVVAIASECLGVTLAGVLWSRPLSKRAANLLFAAGIAGTALLPVFPDLARRAGIGPLPSLVTVLQGALTLVTAAVVLASPRWFGGLAIVGQVGLALLGNWQVGSEYELMFAHFAWIAVLLGVHALRATPPRRAAVEVSRGYALQDLVIFCATFALAVYVADRVFERVVYNGDEVANSFQADVYGHFRAYALPRPCAASFENYWVYNYQGRLFSQYTPGWPLFMAAFQRLGVIWLSGPAAAGILAVGVARLSRRVVSGFGATPEDAARIRQVAGPLGAGFLMLGPSVLLNAGSRFSHILVAACFAWAVECAAVVATRGVAPRRALGYGLGLGAATALGLATRPADGGMLGVGVFLYFASALVRRRISWPAFLGTASAFVAVAGLTLVILRLQVGEWFKTGYDVTPLFHPEGKLILSAPGPEDLKYGIPLATGSYCWWPVAPALGVGGLVRTLRGRERRLAFMLGTSVFCLVGFYSFVTFGRVSDDGLGPRYVLPNVVAQGTGTAAFLAPLLARLFRAVAGARLHPRFRIALAGPGVLVLGSAAVGTALLVPRTYPVAYEENHVSTAPLRAARAQHLENAVVLIEQSRVLAHVTNLAQNAPMDPNPSVLFVIRNSADDEACIAKNYPGRRWYRAGKDEVLTPLPAR